MSTDVDTDSDAGDNIDTDISVNDGESLLSVDDIHTYYGESHVLEDVSIDVYEGEVVALIGRNGVGKTTTLRSILQLTPPREGSIRYQGNELVRMQTDEIAQRGIGWIPEDRRVFSQLTVAENIRIAVPAGGDVSGAQKSMYEIFPALDRFSEQKAGTLSGGQQQMVAIARGLVGKNDLLLVDEPSEGLAPKIVATVAETLTRAAEDATMLLVEQNLPLALDLADRFYVLDNGQVVTSGDTDGVSADDPELRRYLSA